jgi:hypothetical protein
LRRTGSIGLALAALLVGLSPTPPAGARPALSCTATVVPSPNLSTEDNWLSGVSVVSSTDAWAVGYYYAGDPFPIKTLILHWDGGSWRVVASPSPGAAWNVLYGVSALSATDAWAVGYAQNKLSGGAIRSLILHWDGASWSDVHPSLPKNTFSGLTAVHAVAADDVWAVGDTDKPGNRLAVDTLTLHWDGLVWESVPSPDSYDPLNGANWNFLSSVDAASSSDVWSVGNFGDPDNANGDNSTLAMHWDGSRWATVRSPNPKPIDYFRGVSVLSSTEVWAAGYKMLDRYAKPRALVATTDGNTWRVISTDILPSMHAQGIDAVSASEVWIGGDQVGTNVANPIVARWDGTTWLTAVPPGVGGGINAVASGGDGTLWAVGFDNTDYSNARTLVERVTCT